MGSRATKCIRVGVPRKQTHTFKKETKKKKGKEKERIKTF
jgi:hypothetical protein